MISPDLDLDASPIPRSREENQERAFIAASRRKDRSLDARLESANRASMLHKKRTGKSLHITKDIVEKEAMYEEVDERYQEKRIRMLQAQNMQIEEQLNRQLLTALAVRANHRGSISSASSAAATGSSVSSASPKSLAPHSHYRRASSMTPRASIDGVRKMSLDLSSLRSSVSEGMQTGALNSPMIMENGYAMSPGYDTIASPQNAQPEWYSPQVPSYVQQPQWTQQWAGFQSQQEQPQQHIMQDHVSQMPMSFATRPFRNRLASAPEISLHGLPTDSFSMLTPAPMPAQQEQQPQQSQHSRVHSEPKRSMFAVMQNLQPQPSQQPISKPASPKAQATPDAYSSPSTPQQSPRTTSVVPIGVPQTDVETLGKNDEGILFTQDVLDPDFDEFSQFAMGLGTTTELPERDGFGFDDFVTLDDFTTAAA